MRAVMAYDIARHKWVCLHLEMYKQLASCESVVKCLCENTIKSITIIKVNSFTWDEEDGYSVGYDYGSLPDVPTFEEDLQGLRKRLREFKL